MVLRFTSRECALSKKLVQWVHTSHFKWKPQDSKQSRCAALKRPVNGDNTHSNIKRERNCSQQLLLIKLCLYMFDTSSYSLQLNKDTVSKFSGSVEMIKGQVQIKRNSNTRKDR